MNIKFALVAATLVATTLPAQIAPVAVTGNTNISISGLLAIGEKSATITHSSRTGLTTETYLADNTSRLYINSNSKITDGWAVITQIGSRFEPTDGPGTNLVPSLPAAGTTSNYGGFAEDDTWGGISSPYGTVTFGKATVYYSDTIATEVLGLSGPGESYRIWDANGLATFNILDSVMQIGSLGGKAYVPGVTYGQRYTLNNSRSQNVIRYISPRLGDFAFVLNYSKNPYGSELQANVYGATPTPLSYENGGMYEGKLTYNHGPVSASLSLLDVKAQGGPSLNAGNTEAYRAGVSYKDPSGFKAGIVFDHTAVSNSVITATSGAQGDTASRDAFEIPLSYSFGDHAVYVTYSHAGNTSSISNTSASQYNFVYDYALNKRASVGLFCTAIHNSTNAAYAAFLAGTNLGPTSSTTGENWHQIGLNFQYWF